MLNDFKEQWYHCWSPTLGDLEDTPENVWGTLPYDPTKHIDKPVVFCGLYSLPDFYKMWRHKGKKAVLWCGTDITHFRNGYWLEDGGYIKLTYQPLAEWIQRYCDSYVENNVEKQALKDLGITSEIVPSFLAKLSDYSVSFKSGNKVYTSVSGDNFDQYGWFEIEELAWKYPEIEFHLYGNKKDWKTFAKNVIVHGRIPKEQMNKEIKEMQGALRLTDFDGCSELICKAMLWGQWPISKIKYPFVLPVKELGKITKKKEPNLQGRKYFLEHLNKYPWAKHL